MIVRHHALPFAKLASNANSTASSVTSFHMVELRLVSHTQTLTLTQTHSQNVPFFPNGSKNVATVFTALEFCFFFSQQKHTMYPFSCIKTFSQFASLERENNGSRSTTTHTHTSPWKVASPTGNNESISVSCS